MNRIFDPPLDLDDLDVANALHDLVDDIEDALNTNDLSAATKTPEDPVAAKIWEDFWKAVAKWIAEHAVIGEIGVDPNRPGL